MLECLTRTGPLFEVKAEELEPLPNLAKSWEWSEDGHDLTMHLVEGTKWSDGDPFDSEDLMFYWTDHVLDPNITPTSPALAGNVRRRRRPSRPRRLHPEVDVQGNLPQAVPLHHGLGSFCPPPAHIFKPMHPTYNADMTATTSMRELASRRNT